MIIFRTCRGREGDSILPCGRRGGDIGKSYWVLSAVKGRFSAKSRVGERVKDVHAYQGRGSFVLCHGGRRRAPGYGYGDVQRGGHPDLGVVGGY